MEHYKADSCRCGGGGDDGDGDENT